MRIASFPPSQFASEGGLRELFPELPNSLLLRLLIHAALVNAAEVARWANGVHGPLLDPTWFDDKITPVIAAWGQQYGDAMLGADPATDQLRRGRSATFELASAPAATLERVLRATLDTAMYRIDPWVIGIAWRRLRTLDAATPAPRFRLGAYGWVDAPRPRSVAAPPDEYFHAPSEAQALTTAILRDRALYDDEPTRWQIDAESDGIRLAKALADEVNVGAHLVEAVGRAVERAVGDRAQVEALRGQFPIRTEHSGRRTCDGLAVLRRYATNPASLALSPAQLAGIGTIAEAIDTYGDLLVADAVHDVVSGRAGLAGAAMEAAAGLAAPPELGVLRTQRSGRAVTSTVLVALPAGNAPAVVDAHTSPGRLAEPAVADALIALTGAGASAGWTWTVLDDTNSAIGSVSLADLGLEPIDTLSLSPGDLVAIVLDEQPGDHVEPATLEAHVRARRLADILGSQPAAPADLTIDASNPSGAAVQAELLTRYVAVHGLAVTVQAALAAAPGGSETDQRAALLDAVKWGITPIRVDDASIATRLDASGDGTRRSPRGSTDGRRRRRPHAGRAGVCTGRARGAEWTPARAVAARARPTARGRRRSTRHRGRDRSGLAGGRRGRSRAARSARGVPARTRTARRPPVHRMEQPAGRSVADRPGATRRHRSVTDDQAARVLRPVGCAHAGRDTEPADRARRARQLGRGDPGDRPGNHDRLPLRRPRFACPPGDPHRGAAEPDPGDGHRHTRRHRRRDARAGPGPGGDGGGSRRVVGGGATHRVAGEHTGCRAGGSRVMDQQRNP